MIIDLGKFFSGSIISLPNVHVVCHPSYAHKTPNNATPNPPAALPPTNEKLTAPGISPLNRPNKTIANIGSIFPIVATI